MADVVIDIQAKDSTRKGVKGAETGLERLGREGKRSIGRVDEAIGLASRQLSVGLVGAARKAGKGVSTLSRSASKGLGNIAGAAGKATKIVAGLGVAGAIAGVALVGNFLTGAKELSNFSKRTGLSAEALQRFGHAAEQSGSSIDAVVGLTGTLAERLLEVEAGSEDVAAQFAGLGLNVAELQQLNPEAQFLALADAIAAVEDPTERLGRAQMLLGGEAGELLPLLAGGSEAVRALGAELAATGSIMSNETVASAAEVSEAFNLAKEAIIGIAVDGFSALLPHLETFGEFLNTHVLPVITTVIDAIKGFIGGIVTAVQENWDKIAGVASTAWEEVKKVVEPLITGIETAIKAVVTFVEENWDDIETAAGEIWGGVKTVAETALTAIETALTAIVKLVEDNWEPAFIALKDAVVGVFNFFKDEAIPVILEVVEEIRTLVLWMGNLVDSMFRLQDAMIIMATVAGGLLVAKLTLATIALVTLAIAQGIALGPVLLLVGGLLLLGVGISLIVRHWGTLKRVTIAVWNRIKYFLLAALVFIGAPLAALIVAGVLIIRHWDVLRDAAIAVWDKIKEIIGGVINFVIAVVKGFVDSTVTAFNTIKTAVTTAVRTTRDTVVGAFRFVRDQVTGAVETARDGVVTAFNFVKDKVIGAVSATRDTVVGVWQAIKNGVIFAANAMVAGIEGAINLIIRGINKVVRLWNGIEFRTPFGGRIGTPRIDEIGEISIRRISTALTGSSLSSAQSRPTLASLQSGGFVQRTGLAMVEAGEQYLGVGAARVSPLGGGPSIVVNLVIEGSVVTEDDLERTIVEAVNRGVSAGNVRVA